MLPRFSAWCVGIVQTPPCNNCLVLLLLLLLALLQRSAREAVFLSCVIPWWVGPCGYLALAVLSIICMPLLYPPGEETGKVDSPYAVTRE